MNKKDLKILVQEIVKQASILKNKHTNETLAQVNYACIFSQNKEEYGSLVKVSKTIGKVLEEMPTGLLFQIKPLKTVSGILRLLKIRIPDVSRPEKGDADFTVSNYSGFKKKYIFQKGFKLIKKREDFEMLELVDSEFNVRAYFSNYPMDEQLGLK